MQQIAVQRVWVDGYRPVPMSGTEGIGRKIWKYGWGLFLVLIMTVLSEYGPRTMYSKMASDSRAVARVAVHSIK